MEIQINDQKNNPLLERTEVHFTVHHMNDQTPTRDAVREQLAAHLNSKKGLVVVEKMNSEFGRSVTHGYARVYTAPEQLGKIESTHLLKRNKLEDLKPKRKKEA